MNNKKVVVDSNVWISYLLNKELHLFVLKVLESDLQIIEEATKNNINAITITQFKQLTS